MLCQCDNMPWACHMQAEQYVQAFSQLAKSSTTLLLPGNVGDPSAMVAQAAAIYSKTSSAFSFTEKLVRGAFDSLYLKVWSP